MSAKCQNCSRVSPDAFLCGQCAKDLREMLRGLAIGFLIDNGRYSRPWLACLEDAANGDTRLGESARRSTDRTSPLMFSESASTLLRNVQLMLGTWVKHICESRGVPLP